MRRVFNFLARAEGIYFNTFSTRGLVVSISILKHYMAVSVVGENELNGGSSRECKTAGAFLLA